MARIRGKDTGPEIFVRKLVHGLGYRYRLHKSDLPGKPDLVFSGRRKVIFVHGCFWHRHEGCSLSTMPSTRPEFWQAKFKANVERDKRVVAQLKNEGWDVLVVWECETKSVSRLERKIVRFLEGH